jgi:hypothetical protein
MNECLSVEDAVYALLLLHIMCEEVLHADVENFTPTSMYAWHTCSRWYTPDST